MLKTRKSIGKRDNDSDDEFKPTVKKRATQTAACKAATLSKSHGYPSTASALGRLPPRHRMHDLPRRMDDFLRNRRGDTIQDISYSRRWPRTSKRLFSCTPCYRKAVCQYCPYMVAAIYKKENIMDVALKHLGTKQVRHLQFSDKNDPEFKKLSGFLRNMRITIQHRMYRRSQAFARHSRNARYQQPNPSEHRLTKDPDDSLLRHKDDTTPRRRMDASPPCRRVDDSPPPSTSSHGRLSSSLRVVAWMTLLLPPHRRVDDSPHSALSRAGFFSAPSHG
ncbi:hypothetical protein FISHEDRAFT_74904 [Fistulina hepatica ATCC 64428]|uniref:Uncharacterized protein n=1 Tax=Fistulina hepatica ATCC 64428 TaxID=1128425 RepID=A0A0D7A852_9AGAR|nr:hypothetical protein FISHEDRAFT_74904 [Fistulina hepatica ATCC 64428]